MKDENALQNIFKIIQLFLKHHASINGQDKLARALLQRCHTGLKLKLRGTSELKQSSCYFGFYFVNIPQLNVFRSTLFFERLGFL